MIKGNIWCVDQDFLYHPVYLIELDLIVKTLEYKWHDLISDIIFWDWIQSFFLCGNKMTVFIQYKEDVKGIIQVNLLMISKCLLEVVMHCMPLVLAFV